MKNWPWEGLKEGETRGAGLLVLPQKFMAEITAKVVVTTQAPQNFWTGCEGFTGLEEVLARYNSYFSC